MCATGHLIILDIYDSVDKIMEIMIICNGADIVLGQEVGLILEVISKI